MQSLHRAAAIAALVLPLAAAPVWAQNYRFDLGVNGGVSWYSDALDEDDLFPSTGDVGFETGWLVGTQATFWLSPRIGIRANGTYTDRPLTFSNGDIFDDDDFNDFNDIDLVESVNLWSLTGDLMFRFTRPRERWRGFEWLPYLALGAGAKFINPAGSFDIDGDTLIVDGDTIINSRTIDGAPFITPGGAFILEKDTKFMGLVGIGTDLRFTPNFAVRLEADRKRHV